MPVPSSASATDRWLHSYRTPSPATQMHSRSRIKTWAKRDAYPYTSQPFHMLLHSLNKNLPEDEQPSGSVFSFMLPVERKDKTRRSCSIKTNWRDGHPGSMWSFSGILRIFLHIFTLWSQRRGFHVSTLDLALEDCMHTIMLRQVILKFLSIVGIDTLYV